LVRGSDNVSEQEASPNRGDFKMKSRKNVEAVVSSMGALLAIMVDLVAYIRELKGEVGECIYRLARPEGKETLKAVADLLVTDWLKWKIDNESTSAETSKKEVGDTTSKDDDQIPPETLALLTLRSSVTDHDLIRDPRYENDPLFKGMYRGGIAQAIAVRHWKGGKSAKPVIDCDCDPLIPGGGWAVEEHVKGGQLEFDPSQIELYLDESQKNGKSVVGNKLRELLAGKPTLNANVLDYLLANPELIPEEWKDKFIFFWGTIYRISDGSLCVRCLYWNDDRWDWSYVWLGNVFDDNYPAALRK
jgi:hypothetical protein